MPYDPNKPYDPITNNPLAGTGAGDPNYKFVPTPAPTRGTQTPIDLNKPGMFTANGWESDPNVTYVNATPQGAPSNANPTQWAPGQTYTSEGYTLTTDAFGNVTLTGPDGAVVDPSKYAIGANGALTINPEISTFNEATGNPLAFQRDPIFALKSAGAPPPPPAPTPVGTPVAEPSTDQGPADIVQHNRMGDWEAEFGHLFTDPTNAQGAYENTAKIYADRQMPTDAGLGQYYDTQRGKATAGINAALAGRGGWGSSAAPTMISTMLQDLGGQQARDEAQFRLKTDAANQGWMDILNRSAETADVRNLGGWTAGANAANMAAGQNRTMSQDEYDNMMRYAEMISNIIGNGSNLMDTETANLYLNGWGGGVGGANIKYTNTTNAGQQGASDLGTGFKTIQPFIDWVGKPSPSTPNAPPPDTTKTYGYTPTWTAGDDWASKQWGDHW